MVTPVRKFYWLDERIVADCRAILGSDAPRETIPIFCGNVAILGPDLRPIHV
jgi:hypothetical protein